MSTARSSGRAPGSSIRARSSKAADFDKEQPYEAERREFHAEQPPDEAEEAKAIDRSAFRAEIAESGITESGAMPKSQDTGLAGDFRQAASEATSAVKEQAAKLVSDVGGELGRSAEAQKRRGTKSILGVAHAMDKAAEELEQQSPLVARYVRDTARQVENFSGSLSNRSIGDLIQTASDMARSHPIAAFGGAVAAGILLSRFLKSSAQHQHAARGNGGQREFIPRDEPDFATRPRPSDMGGPVAMS